MYVYLKVCVYAGVRRYSCRSSLPLRSHLRSHPRARVAAQAGTVASFPMATLRALFSQRGTLAHTALLVIGKLGLALASACAAAREGGIVQVPRARVHARRV